MSAQRGGRPRGGASKGKAAKGPKASRSKTGGPKTGGSRASGSKTGGPKASGSKTSDSKTGGARGVSGSRGKRIPHLGKATAVRSSGARVVWPPQERTETARDAIEGLRREAGLARRFEPGVERAARAAAKGAWSKADAEVEAGERRDLGGLATFTIDPATARDFDDAISAERLDSDLASPAVRVWVHIADVAAHV